MIITLKGCTATAFIGGLNFFKVSKGTVSGADVTISASTINKDAATSTSAREIATVALKSNYKTLVVTVTMGGTTVNWFANGKVTIPANTTVTGDIKISASATAVVPDVPVTPGDEGEAYWVGEKLSGKTHGTGTSSSYLGAQYYYVTDEDAISELSGKTVDKMAFNFASKSGANTPAGTITVYLVNPSNSVTSNWEAKAEIAVESYTAGSQKEFDITPFTVPTGYTIGYRASRTNILGGGYMMEDYKFDGAFYEKADDTDPTVASLGGVDIHIQGM